MLNKPPGDDAVLSSHGPGIPLVHFYRIAASKARFSQATNLGSDRVAVLRRFARQGLPTEMPLVCFKQTTDVPAMRLLKVRFE
jgi:hypothetical protein